MKNVSIVAALILACAPTLASAEMIVIPANRPASMLTLPDYWEPAKSEAGILAASPDNAAAIYLEVVAYQKEINSVIEESIKLTEDHDVRIDNATRETQDFENGGRRWNRVSWSGASRDWGPAMIGFLSTDVGDGKVLTITYWVSRKDSERSLKTLNKIVSSVRTLP
ncbi:hypothetical protein [Prosthecobacter sp.]|uniref:hypothetical protein n=1 Tax=Prosthecobacter sp. TaxID=1965333 RepID=UPI003784657B